MYSVKSNKRRKKGEEKEKKRKRKREKKEKKTEKQGLYISICPLFILNAVIFRSKPFFWSMYIIKPYLYL